MYIFVRVIILLLGLNNVRSTITCSNAATWETPPVCTNVSSDPTICSTLLAATGFEPLDLLVDMIDTATAGTLSSSVFGTFYDYFTWVLKKSPLDTSNEMTMAKSFNLIIYRPQGTLPAQNISLVEILKNCLLLNLNGTRQYLVMGGYGNNYNGQNPQQVGLGWSPQDWQKFADLRKAVVMIIDYSVNGLSSSGYPQIIKCSLFKIVDFLIYFIKTCAILISKLFLIGFSLGAQIIGYVGKYLRMQNQPVPEFHAIDPAGIGFGIGGDCQGSWEAADFTVVYHFNPGVMGTADMCLGDVTVLGDAQCGFWPKLCRGNYNPACPHSVACQIFKPIALNLPVQATFPKDYPNPLGSGETVSFTMEPHMPIGYYNLNTYGSSACF